MSVRDVVRNNWPAITITVTAAAIAWAAVVMLHNLPPRVVVMAAGPEGDTYYEIGRRYRAALARAGIDLRLVPTAGSVENLDMLLDRRSEVGVALIESGINSAGGTSRLESLESLGTVFYEPMWWFRRRESPMEGADSLQGRKISIGPEGSGTRALALQLIKRTGLEGRLGEVLRRRRPPARSSWRVRSTPRS
jgi:TRAP-type uncharacterized transport system substrate-binding protein